ncbi:MAG: hypothetical protein AB1813_19920 [Verrucomicrobiota bacterium]|jgi:ElaB/YqjD/DUF883 family membrane-anchored ribosome-binding protein
MERAKESDLENIADQIEEGVRRGKFSWAEIQSTLVDRTKEAARTTDRYVHENPWQMIGIAAAAGLLIGLLIRRH